MIKQLQGESTWVGQDMEPSGNVGVNHGKRLEPPVGLVGFRLLRVYPFLDGELEIEF